MGYAYRFNFDKRVTDELIESKVADAIKNAEYAFGKPLVRLNAGYAVKNNQAVIDISNAVGKYIARVFTDYIIEDIGEKKFSVFKIKTKN